MVAPDSSFNALTGVIVGVSVAVAIAGIAFTVARSRTASAPVDRDRVLDAQKGWRAPADLAAASIPRAVKLTGTAWILMAVLGLVVAGSGVLSWVTAQRVKTAQAEKDLLAREGVATRGTVSEKHRNSGKNENHRVTYTYEANGVGYAATARVTRAFYNSVNTGSSIPVTYARTNPGVQHIDGQTETPSSLPYFVLLPMLICFLLPYMVWRQKQLLAFGTPACGVVERVAPVKGGWAVTYRFLDSSGESVRGRSSVSSREKPPAGDTITIVYDPERPRRNSRYPLKFARLSDA